jgi:hypothetical protein
MPPALRHDRTPQGLCRTLSHGGRFHKAPLPSGLSGLGRRDCPLMVDPIRSHGSVRHEAIDDVHTGMNPATPTPRGFGLAKIR